MAAPSQTNPPLLFHPLLPTLNFHLSILGSRSCRFSQSHGSKIQNRLKNSDVRSCNSNNGTKIIQFNIAPLRLASFHKDTDPQNRLRKFGGAKVQFQQCRSRKNLISFFLTLSTLHLCTCNFHNHTDPSLRKFEGAKVQLGGTAMRLVKSIVFMPLS